MIRQELEAIIEKTKWSEKNTLFWEVHNHAQAALVELEASKRTTGKYEGALITDTPSAIYITCRTCRGPRDDGDVGFSSCKTCRNPSGS